MYCQNCGELIEPGEVFCTQCGSRVGTAGYGNKSSAGNRSYGIRDLGREGVPGSRLALFGIVFCLLSIVVGEIGMITSFVAVILLIAARICGFRSIWIWIGVLVSCGLCMNALMIESYRASLETSLFIGNMIGFLGLFF